MTQTKSQTLTITGTVEKCEVVREMVEDRDSRYSPNTEFYGYWLDIALRTDEGMVYFKTPRSIERVASCPVAAIVTYRDAVYNKATEQYEFPADHPWFAKEGTNHVATQRESSNVQLISKVHVGQTLTIRGRLKATKVSKAGKSYRVFNFVKLQSN